MLKSEMVQLPRDSSTVLLYPTIVCRKVIYRYPQTTVSDGSVMCRVAVSFELWVWILEEQCDQSMTVRESYSVH